MTHKKLLFGLTGACLAAASVAFAHHSYAMFDMRKTVDLKGAVKEFHWTNPHSWIILTTRDAAGKVSDINIEANGPGYLVRQGWKRETLKPGDEITATINPLHDGSPGGSLVKVTMADGRQLSALPKITAFAAPIAPPAGGAGDKQ